MSIENTKESVSIQSLSDVDKKKLRGTIQEIVDSMTRVSAEKDYQKEALNDINDTLGVDKKLVRRIAKTYYKSSFDQEVADNDDFETFFTALIKNTAPV